MVRNIFSNSAYTAILIVGAFSVWLAGNLGAFGINKIVFDVVSYHAYIPATFIKKDLTLQYYKNNKTYYDEKGMYWAPVGPKGNPVIKTTYGLSAMNLPFVAWPLLFTNHKNTEGYELPFSIAIGAATIFYFLASLFILYALLKKMGFSNSAIAFCIYCIGLGTNLLTYASISIGMPHAYNFFLFTLYLYICLLWYEKPGCGKVILLGFILGLLTLIRPTNIILGISFLLLRNTFSLTLLKTYRFQFFVFLICFCIPIIPQLIYWKTVAGSWLYNSYVDEKFFFNDPKIFDYLFGFRKGWFIYTPLAAFAIVGLFIKKYKNPFYLATLLIIPIMIYLNSSWWCWWFGGSHGARAMIETYPLLLPGFAAIYEYFAPHAKRKLVAIIAFLILFNIKSVDLYRANIIHYDGMNFRAFVYTSFKLFFSEEDKEELKKIYSYPDYESAKRGISR